MKVGLFSHHFRYFTLGINHTLALFPIQEQHPLPNCRFLWFPGTYTKLPIKPFLNLSINANLHNFQLFISASAS